MMIIDSLKSALGRVALPALIGLSLLLGACSESQLPVATGKGLIRGIAAINDAPNLLFLIEERSLGSTVYKGVAGFQSFDDLSYTFNFDMIPPGDSDLVRVASMPLDVAADTEYTMILTGTLDNPNIILWEEPEREWPEETTMFEPIFAHFSDEIGAVDVYFAAPGTPPALGNAVGTLANGERISGIDFEAGDYELVLTAPGDPASIVYRSSLIFAPPASRPIMAVFNSDPSITGPVPVNLIGEQGTSVEVPDPAFASQIRFGHVALGVENYDVYFDDDFNNRILSNIAFKETTAYVDLNSDVSSVSLTAVDDPNTVLLQGSISPGLGSRRTLLLTGIPGLLALKSLPDNARPLVNFPVFRITNAALNSVFVNVYQQEPDTEITAFTRPLTVALSPGLDTNLFTSNPGTWDFTLTNFGEIEPIAPVLRVDFVPEEIVEFAILDTVDPEVFELFEFSRQ